MNASPVSSMAGTKITRHHPERGQQAAQPTPTAGTPDRSSDAAISEPASANITDMAGKISVRVASPVTW